MAPEQRSEEREGPTRFFFRAVSSSPATVYAHAQAVAGAKCEANHLTRFLSEGGKAMDSLKCRHILICSVLVLLLGLIPGCSSPGGRGAPPPNPVSQQGQPAQAGAPPPAALSSTPRPYFYDFPDIPTPSELKLLPDESYIFQSGNEKAGLLTLRGRVDPNSVVNFFQMALPRESWKPKGGFRYKRSVLIYEKPEKTCIINLYEKLYYTYVEIYVAPAAGQI